LKIVKTGGNAAEYRDRANELISENPDVKSFNNERGYVLCTITPNRWQSDFRAVPEVFKPNGPVHTRASFVVEAGRQGESGRLDVSRRRLVVDSWAGGKSAIIHGDFPRCAQLSPG
jgi:hypothetical protein